jgi:hypothetical protein
VSNLTDAQTFVTTTLAAMSMPQPPGYALTINGKVTDARGAWPLTAQGTAETKDFVSAIANELDKRGDSGRAAAARARLGTF